MRGFGHAFCVNIPHSLPIASVLKHTAFPSEWPYSAEDFSRQDDQPDSNFYAQPRFCFHVDNAAVAALTKYYDNAFRKWDKPAILDICSSHVSHFPESIAEFAGRRVALGMNEEELKQNRQVNEIVVKDLNADPTLPFPDNSFDIVTNAVSMDYLARPLEVSTEVARVLRPGGVAIFALSNRCFPTKVVNMWNHTNDLEHVFIVGSYFHYSGKFQSLEAVEVSPDQDSSGWSDGHSQNIAYLAVVSATVAKL